jgi:glycosyltransferase involved in cell wall biosynthesis
LEIIIIDSNSPENEEAIIAKYAYEHNNIRYIRTASRETVYGAWNRGIRLADGEYIINANTDDRFAPDALDRMCGELEADPKIHAVYGNWMVTRVENDSFDSSTEKFPFPYPEFFPPLLLYYQITSHAPLIRKSVFQKIGFFDEGLKIYGDREFMLRFSVAGLKAKKIPHTVGLYLESPTSVERSGSSGKEEFTRIRQTYTAPEKLTQLFGYRSIPKRVQLAQLYALAGAWGKDFHLWDGRPISDQAFADELLTKALKIDPGNVVALNDRAVILCLSGGHQRAIRMFQRALRADDRCNVADDIRANMEAASRGSTTKEDYIWLKGHVSGKRQQRGVSSFRSVEGEAADDLCHEGPLVSVIVPTCNRPEMLVEALQSIVRQSYKPIEIIVANDGEDDIAGMISPCLRRARISYFTLDKRRGPAAARNAGLREAKGKYIAYLDDDDIYYPNHLETLVGFLEDSGCGVAYTDSFQAFGRWQDHRFVATRKEPAFGLDFDRKLLLVKNYIPTLNVVHRRDCIDQTGFFDENLPVHEDWDLWIRMSRRFNFYHIKAITAEFRTNVKGGNSRTEQLSDFLRTMKTIHRKYGRTAQDPQIIRVQRNKQAFLECEIFLRENLLSRPLKIKNTTTTRIRATVVIPVRDGADQLSRLLPMIHAQKKVEVAEIRVLDCGSSDDSAEVARKLGAKVISARRHSVNDWMSLCFVKAGVDDCLVYIAQEAMPINRYWLYNMLRPLSQCPTLGLVHCKQMMSPKADLFSLWCGAVDSTPGKGAMDCIYGLSRVPGQMDMECLELMVRQRLAFLNHAAFGIRGKAVREARGLPLIRLQNPIHAVELFRSRRTIAYLASTGIYYHPQEAEEDVFRRYYLATKERVHNQGNDLLYFFTRNGVSWHALAAHTKGTYQLIKTAVDEAVNQDGTTPVAAKKFIDVLRGYVDGSPEKVDTVSASRRIAKVHRFENLLHRLTGESGSEMDGVYDHKRSLLVPRFLQHYESFIRLIFGTQGVCESKEKDFGSAIYKLFAMTAGEMIAAYYLEAEATNRLTADIKRADSLLGEDAKYSREMTTVSGVK